MLTAFFDAQVQNGESKFGATHFLFDGAPANFSGDALKKISFVYTDDGVGRQFACFLTGKPELDRPMYFFGDEAKYIVANWG